MESPVSRGYELHVQYVHHGDTTHIRLSPPRRLEIVRNELDGAIFSELLQFTVGRFTTIFEPNDVVEHVELVARENTSGTEHRGEIVPSGDDQDLPWPPPHFDPSQDDQAFLVLVELTPDGKPLYASWTTR